LRKSGVRAGGCRVAIAVCLFLALLVEPTYIQTKPKFTVENRKKPVLSYGRKQEKNSFSQKIQIERGPENDPAL